MNLSIENVLDLHKIGKSLAHASDNEQGDFLNAFAAELNVGCKGTHKAEMQICYISDKLNRDAQEFILALAEFVKLRQAGI